jgi:hypothetical protein
MESMVKGRIYPRALPNQGQDQSNELKFLPSSPPTIPHVPDKVLKDLVSILLLRRQTDSLDDIANHLAHISKCVIKFPFFQHTTLTTSFDDVVNGAWSLSHPFDKNTLYMRKMYEKKACYLLFETHEIYRR